MKTLDDMSPRRLREIIDRFPRLRIAVVGDFFLDKYLDVDPALAEISLETGKTANQVVSKRHSPGAAGTVVCNVSALGVGALHAVPHGGPLGAQCAHAVEVGTQLQPLAVGGSEPHRHRFRGAVDEAQHRLPPEHAVRLGVVRVGVVARNAKQHRRYAQRQRDFARGDVLGLDEVHVFRRHRHGFPVEPAFQQQRAPGVHRALIVLGQLFLEPRELLFREVPVTGGGQVFGSQTVMLPW